MPIITTTIHTPVGEMIAGVTDDGVCLLDFCYRKHLPAIQGRISTALDEPFIVGNHPMLEALKGELEAYFIGTRRSFSLPIQPHGTKFQLAVWRSLSDIPYGGTSSYLKQAIAYGDEKAIRAVASANGLNGIAIMIPCHRVIGANGSLTGYAGGLSAKKWLLDHERRHAGGDMQTALF